MIDSPSPRQRLTDRLKHLDTKAYYLLVALSFIYSRASSPSSLKWALGLTAVVAVLPVQDWVDSDPGLEAIRVSKVALLVIALGCTHYWLWTARVPA